MRLTLRTMLAYLDDVLEPADAQDLGQKIEESEFATGLVHRIRSSMRRLRLGAPKLEGKGMGLDGNTVAEYLDNTLPPDQVPDFEKVCLESDVHLAEVSASHQILTLVLGEPAEVEPATRDRVYRIGVPNTDRQVPGLATDPSAGESAPPPKSGMSAAAMAAAAPTAPDSTEPKPKTRQKPEIPDYLRSDARVRIWPVVIAGVLALLLVGAVVMAVGPGTVAGWLGMGGDRPVADAGTETARATTDAAATVLPSADAAAATTDSTAATTDAAAATTTEGVDQAGTGGADVAPDLRQPATVAGNGADSREPAGTATPQIAAEDSAPGGAAPGPGPAAAVDPDREAMPPVPPGERSPFVEEGAVGPAPPQPGDDELARIDPLAPPPGVDEPAALPGGPGEPANMGRFTSDQEIMIRSDEESGEWFRVPPRDPVASGDRLVALPTFRPQVMLIGNVQITLDGSRAPVGALASVNPATRATVVRLLGPDKADVPWLQVEYGRVLLITVGKAGAQVGLQIGERRGLLTFGDADSTAALEVRRIQLPGTDPESTDPHTVSGLFATSGTVAWEESGRAPIRVDAGRMLTFLDTVWDQTTDTEDVPKWIAEKDIDDIDRQASEDLRSELTRDNPEISLRLLELSEHRRPEVKSLAIRCGAYLGQFDPFLAAFNDPLQRSYWVGHFDVLTEAVQRSPQTAAQVLDAFKKHRSKDAEQLYRLLWGFSETDLSDGWNAKLVDYLDNDAMDFRVLALENLRRITGGKTALYRPEYTADRRRSPVQRWREMLNNDQVRYATLPISLPGPAGEAVSGPAESLLDAAAP